MILIIQHYGICCGPMSICHKSLLYHTNLYSTKNRENESEAQGVIKVAKCKILQTAAHQAGTLVKPNFLAKI